MRLIVLGSGTGVPVIDRASPSLLLLPDGPPALLDIGPGTLRQLARIGLSHARIGHILITHFHPDHTADLVHFLFATRNPPALSSREPFRITGPRGLRRLLSLLGEAYGPWLDVPSEIMKVEELKTQEQDRTRAQGYEILSLPVNHTPQSLAYRITDPQGRTLVYSGDTGYGEGIVDLGRGADLLVLECSLLDEKTDAHHLSPTLAGRIASLAGAERLLLLHFYPEVLATDIARACRKEYAGELILGSDLLHVSV